MDREVHQLAIRRVVLEYGAMPISSWLQHMDSTAALSQAVVDMRKQGEVDGNRCKPSSWQGTLPWKKFSQTSRMSINVPYASQSVR
jgi:hypothetical protein